MSSNFVLDSDLVNDLTQISQSIPGFNVGQFVNNALRAAVTMQRSQMNLKGDKAKQQWMQQMKKEGKEHLLDLKGGDLKFTP